MKQLLINTLEDAGFEVTEYHNGILVSLQNRKVGTMEVDTVLIDNLEIRMGLSQTAQGVFVGTVTLC